MGFYRWLADLSTSILFIVGYITYYNQIWHTAMSHTGVSPTKRRQRLSFLMLFIALVLQFALWVDPNNYRIYENIQLFVLVFPLLDDHVTRSAYLLRCGALLTFWVFNHLGSSLAPLLVGVAVAVLTMAIIYRWQTICHYNLAANSATVLVISTAYWITSIRTLTLTTLGLVATFMLINLFNYFYWLSLYHQDRQHDRLEQRANFDALTNAKTYALFRRDIQHYIGQAHQNQMPLTLAMLDIDHFKTINDRYGHLAGNTILTAVLARLKQSLRAHPNVTYQVYRTGGEEFNLIFPNQTPDVILPILKDCWQSIRRTPFTVGDDDIAVTLSAGLTGFKRLTDTVDTLYKRVDDNLYQSKHRGRDTITQDGHTLWQSDRPMTNFLWALVAQPIVDLDHQVSLGTEVSTQHFNNAAKRWQLLPQSILSSHVFMSFLMTSLRHTNTDQVVVYMPTSRFIDPAITAETVQVITDHAWITEVVVLFRLDPTHLTEIQQAIPRYHQAHLKLTILVDDATAALTDLPPFLSKVDGITYRLCHDEHGAAKASQQALLALKQLADRHHVYLTLKNMQTTKDLALAQSIDVHIGQGTFFTHRLLPEL